MPRGGSRPGAGRPRKHPKSDVSVAQVVSKVADSPPASSAPSQPQTPASPGPVQPLEYMLSVMNNPEVNAELRARMAVAAAPYCHPKKGEGGKKEQQQDAAKRVASRFGASAPPRPTGKTAH